MNWSMYIYTCAFMRKYLRFVRAEENCKMVKVHAGRLRAVLSGTTARTPPPEVAGSSIRRGMKFPAKNKLLDFL